MTLDTHSNWNTRTSVYKCRLKESAFCDIMIIWRKYQFILIVRGIHILKSVLKDLWIHMVLIFISLFFICKFSSAPQIFYALGFLLEKPSDGTFQYEVFRILENLSLAYLASLIFYLIVD